MKHYIVYIDGEEAGREVFLYLCVLPEHTVKGLGEIAIEKEERERRQREKEENEKLIQEELEDEINEAGGAEKVVEILRNLRWKTGE